MGLEGFHRRDELIQKLRETAHLQLKEKSAIYNAAIDVLPEVVLVHGHGADLNDALKEAIEIAIIEAATTDEENLQQAAIRAVEDVLEKRGIQAPELLRTFVSKLKQQLSA